MKTAIHELSEWPYSIVLPIFMPRGEPSARWCCPTFHANQFSTDYYLNAQKLYLLPGTNYTIFFDLRSTPQNDHGLFSFMLYVGHEFLQVSGQCLNRSEDM